MKEQEISLITAQLAKLKGFDWECRGYYYPKGKFGEKYQEHFGRFNSNKLQTYNDDKGILREIEMYSAPSQSLLQRWLRDVSGIHVIVDNYIDSDNILKGYCVFVYINYQEKVDLVLEFIKELSNIKIYESYEQALEAGLLEALKLINDKS